MAHRFAVVGMRGVSIKPISSKNGIRMLFQGSRWTLQATKMDGRLGLVTIKPDQLQVLAPICILIFIPITQKFLYPFCERRNVLRNPLHKMILGACLAGVAFVASGVVEIYLKAINSCQTY